MAKAKKKLPTYEEMVFETDFVRFWESHECTELNRVLYDLMKAAYAAGYRAAGKEPPQYPRKVHTFCKTLEEDRD